MQIYNFYADPFPWICMPLDSIVLNPHTTKPKAFSLTTMKEDCL